MSNVPGIGRAEIVPREILAPRPRGEAAPAVESRADTVPADGPGAPSTYNPNGRLKSEPPRPLGQFVDVRG